MYANPSRSLAEVQRSTPSFVAAGATDHSLHFDRVIHMMPSPLVATASASPLPSGTRSAGVQRAMTPTQTSRAKSPSAGAAVHESLLERGKLYEQRKEALREKSVRRELSRCRSVPRISRMGHDIERASDIKDRLMAVFHEKQKVKEFDRIIADKKEDEIIQRWFEPQISHKGKRAQGRTASKKQQHETWEYKRAQRLETLRREKILREMQDLHGAPDIDPKSQLLAARRREREGLAGYTHVEAMLERDRLSRLARWEEQQRQQALVAQAATPKITGFAASLNRGDDVGERLQREAEARERRRVERERQYLDELAGGKRHGPLSPGGHGQQQQLGGGQGGAAAFDPDSLVERHATYMQRRDEKIRSIQDAERALHTPAIDPVSEKLAARLPMSPMERLVQPRAKTPTSRMTASDASGSAPRSSRPTAAAAGGFSDNDVQAFERLQLAEARRKLRVEAARAEQATRQLAECTFRPQTTSHYYDPAGSIAAGAASDTSDTVYTRNHDWQQRREGRLEEQRRLRDDQQRAAHPFSPIAALRSANGGGGGSSSAGVDVSTEDVSGFNSFLARQQVARSRRAGDSEAGGAPSATTPRRPLGPDGRPLQTVPVAPALGRQRDPAQTPVVLSLLRPVEAPSFTTYIAPRDATAPPALPGGGRFHEAYGYPSDAAGGLASALLRVPQALGTYGQGGGGGHGGGGLHDVRGDDAMSFGSDEDTA